MENSPYSWRGGFCQEVSPVANTLIIFGAAGDLAHRKLFPALFQLERRKLFHAKSRILACTRQEFSCDVFREQVRASIILALPQDQCPCEIVDEFLGKIFHTWGDYNDSETYSRMKTRLEEIESNADNTGSGRIFYLSTPAPVYAHITNMLYESGLSREPDDFNESCGWRHLVLEKPFGYDLESAKELDMHLHKTLKERQIYRIDHYLGKETVQNILIFRFANLLFETVWNRNYIDSVQITVAETVGVEHRANYFDKAGLLRDMFQNHMLEMLSLVAMEIPAEFEAGAIRDQKLQLLRSIRPFDVNNLKDYIVRAQYTSGKINEEDVPAYRDEVKVPSDSTTETFVAAQLFIDNWRWQGVPFFLRSGKRLPGKSSEIVINFKSIPHSIFNPIKVSNIMPNRLILTVQPEEGLVLTIQAKQPGPKLCMGSLNMNFKYSEILESGEQMPDAYERLLLDCMSGDQTLFIRSDTILLAWEILTPILNAWKNNTPNCGELYNYPAGSWGPDMATDMLFNNGRYIWHNAVKP